MFQATSNFLFSRVFAYIATAMYNFLKKLLHRKALRQRRFVMQEVCRCIDIILHKISITPDNYSFRKLSPFTPVADLRGGRRGRPPGGPNSFDFMQFLGNFGKIVCCRPPPGELAPPPRGNPGSATAHQQKTMSLGNGWQVSIFNHNSNKKAFQ